MTTVETVRCDLCAYQLADVTATTASNVFRGRCLTHGRRTILLRSTGLARATDPQTSQDAAESINPRGQQEKLLRTLAHMTDANRYELAQAAGLTEYQAGRRLSELNDSEDQAERFREQAARKDDKIGFETHLDVELPKGTEMVMPGDNIKMVVTLITPIAMEQGLRFAIREGGKTVGAGVVAKVIE